MPDKTIMRTDKILELYLPTLQKIKEVQDHYNGKKDGKRIGPPIICPDITGELINEFIRARKIFNIID